MRVKRVALILRLLPLPCLVFAAGCAVSSVPAPAVAAAPPKFWTGELPPFSFSYGGRHSSTFLASWGKSWEPGRSSDGGETRSVSYVDPATGLTVTAEVRTFADFDAVEWVLRFSNEGKADTPIIEDIEALDSSLPSTGASVLHHARGSAAKLSDFEPLTDPLLAGKPVELANRRGRSSNGTLPFFNLDDGAGGVVGAVGWTGDWSAAFAFQEHTGRVSMRAGMRKTHLLLHPGETIRTPRILLLNWKGADWNDAQNTWRRLILAHYAPQRDHQPVVGPVCAGSWGAESIDRKLAQLAMIHDHHLPFDVYWVDAGWYGTSEGESDTTSSPWWRSRGSWTPHRLNYPKGLGPLGDAVRDAGLQFLLWIEPETVMAGSVTFTEHPDWTYAQNPYAAHPDGPDLINLGNPEARRGITDLVSGLITQGRVAWYRQDFNTDPDAFWKLADTPDRIGMSEIRHIEGLYQFWDDLRARHPDLLIDNCASGGRRLDLEMISRSFALWRSDLKSDPIGSQGQTVGLAPWVPLNAGVDSRAYDYAFLGHDVRLYGDGELYGFRSGYSAALVSTAGPAGAATETQLAWLARALAEYREVRPFTTGDFHPLVPYSVATDAWAAWQWDRPGRGDGCAVVLRRPENAASALVLALHGLDAGARYSVEIRRGLDREPVRVLSGRELGALQVEVPDKPGSALVLYARQ